MPRPVMTSPPRNKVRSRRTRHREQGACRPGACVENRMRAHLRALEIEAHVRLEDYEAVAHLAAQARELRAVAAPIAQRLRGRTVWMVSSTAQGGGVAEMMPR